MPTVPSTAQTINSTRILFLIFGFGNYGKAYLYYSSFADFKNRYSEIVCCNAFVCFRNFSEKLKHPAADGLCVAIYFRTISRAVMPVTLESGQRYIAVDVELVFRYECDRGDYLIILVPYFTDKLFEYVFKSVPPYWSSTTAICTLSFCICFIISLIFIR